MSFDEVITDDDFEIFINNHFNFVEHEELLHDKKFITLLLTNPNLFRDFSYSNFKNEEVAHTLFSSENSTAIKSIQSSKLIQSLNYIMNLENCYKIFLEDHNYYLLNNNLNFHSFLAPLIEYANEDDIAHNFIIKHPDYITSHSLYSKVSVSNPLTSLDLEMLSSIKSISHIDGEDAFYSKFSNDVINALVDSGYYSFLSKMDKKAIINNGILSSNNYKSPLSINLFKNKDFFNELCKVTRLNATEIIKVLNYINIHHPEIYSTYDSLFKKLVKEKENKEKDDISYLLFDDYFENVKLNVEIIKDYANSNEFYKSRLDSNKLEILSRIDFDKINTNEDVMNLYKTLIDNNVNYKEVMYDYISLARDTFASDIKSSMVLPSSSNKHDDSKGVNIHYYEGEPLSFVVHSSAIKSGSPQEFATNRVKKLDSSNQISKYLSTSYINESNLNVYEDEAIIYGFYNLDNMHLISAHHSDAFTSNNLDDPVTRASNYSNLKEFSNHNSYSELVYKIDKLKPDFIVCFDEVDDYDLEVAKKLNIDIVCINRKKYEHEQTKVTSKSKNAKYINH